MLCNSIDNRPLCCIIYNMRARPVSSKRIYLTDTAFASISIWHVPQSVKGCAHEFKYRLAYIVDEVCVLRYDNESGKGDHRHYGNEEAPYAFTTLAALLADFQADIERWNHEENHRI